MNHVDHKPLIHWHCYGRLLLLLGMLLLSLGGVAWPGAPATAATTTLQGAPQVVGVLRGTASSRCASLRHRSILASRSS